jgi:hypothetical protein
VFAGHNEHETSPGESLKLPGGHGVQDRDLGMFQVCGSGPVDEASSTHEQVLGLEIISALISDLQCPSVSQGGTCRSLMLFLAHLYIFEYLPEGHVPQAPTPDM